MIHIRIDDNELNKDAKFACGIGWPLPEGDQYYFESEVSNRFRYNKVDCRGCAPDGPVQIGTPLSELSGNAMDGGPKYERFKDIAASWGYD